MDGTPAIGTFNPASAYPVAGQPPAVAATALGLSSPGSTSQADSDAAAQEINDAPSPSPQAIVADTKGLPPNVRFAPSSAPHDASIRTNFDRRA